jgi:hypothetical protein
MHLQRDGGQHGDHREPAVRVAQDFPKVEWRSNELGYRYDQKHDDGPRTTKHLADWFWHGLRAT